MKILGIESASLTASAALLSEKGLLGEFTVNYHKTHSETLLPMIDEMLSVIGAEVSDVDAIAVSEGPGSFTGLRIGASLAKGLAFAAERPIVPVPTLDAMAYGMQGSEKLICPIMDARRGEVYGGIYGFFDGKFRVLRPVEALPLREFIGQAAKLSEETGRKAFFLGDGLTVHEEAVRSMMPEAEIALPQLRFQKAGNVAALGLELFSEGRAVEPEAFSPVYLRMSQAERERLDEGLSILPAETASIEPVQKDVGEIS
ncbi:MAG: tRNA (adenosine(37)-N6)-threonylcarbamoyltransferase complex dimerization subunit type 1 TsaB [Lachnospiraceae bacterium]|nr:tRNA (adenosine(37)-N6)-threonylcarbamoyltransferase complex dimerization subunit type 1 TsaB [Lachnospiraceae bacterium]